MAKKVILNVDLLYPVGSIYLTTISTNPKYIFGGEWEQIKDTFLLACGDSYQAGATGGEATHKLTINEMPSHNHGDIAGYFGNGYHSKTFNWLSTSSGSFLNYIVIPSQGGNQAHNNMPPYLAIYVWKRVS